MNTPEINRHSIPLFTHNCQIKNDLTTLILDNVRQNNMISQELVEHMQLPTTQHLDPYQLGWV
jgi:hypothetical protein